MIKKNKKEELNRVLKKYNFEEVECVGEIDADLLANAVLNVKSFEGPDAYSVVGDTVYIIEHFEFDSYKNNKKGSQYKNELADKEREFKKTIVNGEGMLSEMITSDSSFSNYVDNFLKHLDNHYGRIETYKKNLIQELPNAKEFKIWFFAEDTDAFAPMINTAEIFCCVQPLNFKRAQDWLKEKDEIDGIIIGSCFGDNTYHMLFVKKEFFGEIKTFSEEENILGTNSNFMIYQFKVDTSVK